MRKNRINIPPDNEFLEEIWNIQYARKADALAQSEVAGKTGIKWGRWLLLNGRGLCTPAIVPPIGKAGTIDYGMKVLPIEQINQNWLADMSQRNYIAEQGIIDLAKALLELRKIPS